MNHLTGGQYTAFIGMDWADAKHDICLQAAGSEQREFDCLPHQVDRIEQWALSIHKRFGEPIAIALELSKGPIVYALQKYDFFVLFPVNPSTLAKYREAFTPSRAKDDPTDAELALDLLLRHPDRFKPLAPQSVAMRALITLVEQRRDLVNDRVRITNRLRNALKQYYPQMLEWFEHIDTLLFCDFLTRWPTLTQVKRARKRTLERFFHAHNMRFSHVLDARLKAIKAATPLTLDAAVIMPHRLHALMLAEQLRVTLKAIARFDDEIAELAPKHPDYELFSALPGAGPSLAPRLLVAFGEQRQRFTSAAEVQGPLAMAVPDLPAPNLCRVGRADDQQIVLGGGLLSSATRERLFLPGRRTRPGLQVDPHSLPLLADTDPVQRGSLPQCPETSRIAAP
jgi:transposase